MWQAESGRFQTVEMLRGATAFRCGFKRLKAPAYTISAYTDMHICEVV